MCRLLGVVSRTLRSFDRVLSEAPRSLAVLSEAHGDGWGVAASRRGLGWTIERSTLRARDDPRFWRLARAMLGDLMIAHVRQRTLGSVTLENTHPFGRGGWIFAHNGTVHDVAYVQDRTSQSRRDEIAGETDSERLFAFLLTCLDEIGDPAAAEASALDRALLRARHLLRDRAGLGTASFLLSNGAVLYAHRLGPPLHVLERRGSVPPCRRCDSVAPCVAVSTEPATDESWVELPDGALVRVDRDPAPRWRRLDL